MSEKEIDEIDDITDMVRTMTSIGVSSKGLRTLDEMKQRVKETLKESEKKCSWTAKEKEKEIDEIDDIVDMARTMTTLGISSKGLRTLDEMKQRVKETLSLSEKKSSWTAKEVEQTADSVSSSSVHVSKGSQSATFTNSKQHTEATKVSYVRYAFSLVSDYLSSQWNERVKGPQRSESGKATLGITDEAQLPSPEGPPTKAFSVLTDAKQEDERKRDILYKFYEDTEVCLNSVDDNIRRLLEQNIPNYKEKIAWHKKKLEQKEYIVLVAGETSSGKSTLLNLILGEQLLPHSVLSTTSTICELKYGSMPKLVAHFKDKDPQTGHVTKTVQLCQSRETPQQSNLEEISSFVHVKTDRKKGSDYKKVELFWPHNLLKQGIVIVDSPGVGESGIMDDMVKEYLPEAFAFIYVINSVNAGGIQRDRLEKLIEHARKVSLDQQREMSSTSALFVCNKWDQVPLGEANEVKNHIVKKLTHCWPNLDPHSQIIYMSSTDASKAQALGIITEEFAGLMIGIKSMVLKSIEARLQTKWRWLDYLLFRMAYHTKAFIKNSHKDRQQIIERMTLITERLLEIEKQQSSVNKELQDYLDNKRDYAVRTLSNYLKSSAVVKKFTSWTLDDVPNTEESWEVTRNFIQKAIKERLHDVIASWEEENHVFSEASSSLIQYFQERFHFVEGQLKNLETSVVAEDGASPSSDPLVAEKFSAAERVIIGVTSPIWVPVGLVVLIVSVPVVGAMTIKEKYENWSKTREYEKDKSGFMAKASKEYLIEAAEEQNLRSYVVEQLRECEVFLRQVVARIPELIAADKLLCQQLRDENRSQKEIEDFYKPLYRRSLQLRDRMAMFGINEVRTMEISSHDLEWQDDSSSLLGTGAFASVYRGKLKLPEKEQPVALKVWKDQLNDYNASTFLAEAEALRKLNYPHIVKFYGSSLLKEGDQVRAVLVMEVCKENLMKHIFQNPKNIPATLRPSSTLTDRITIGWAKDIANGLEYIHKQGYVHRDLKLENILISLDGVVKIADVGVSKEEKMITGTMAGTPAFMPPEVIRSRVYGSKADMYSFGIMMWEMWYGRRAYLDVEGDLYTLWDRVAEGIRPSHVGGTRMPPDQWQDLMHSCWDGEAEKRPTATTCHNELTKLYSTA